MPASIAGGRYRVLRLLGEGRSKVVYLAHDTAIDRDVAVALFKVDQVDEAGRERTRREARAMGRLGEHPNIVGIYDVGDENGRPFIVSQYMPGGSVDDLLRRRGRRGLALDDALRIAAEVADALDYAHSRGVIHRDLKPANVFIAQDGQSMLGDFGLAIAPDQSRLTVQGMMVGTVSYMPPEQTLGKPLEPRSDLYSLGAMLFEMLTGRPPFIGDDLMAILTQHVSAVPLPPSAFASQVPPALDDLVLRMLAKTPEARPASASAVRDLLRSMTSAQPAAIDVIASTVMMERPNLRAQSAPDGTVSILFSDVENSTVMTERLGDLRALEVLAIHNRIIREQVAAQQGYEVKAMGDGFMIAFASARRAMHCAIGIQRALADYCRQNPGVPIRVRIGINMGEAIQEEGDFFGKAVILAARIGAAAKAGEILISPTVKEVTQSAGDFRFDDGREMQLKGLAGNYRVYRVKWAAADQTCPRCARPLPADAEVCPFCTASVPRVAASTAPDNAPEQTRSVAARGRAGSSRSWIALAIVAVVVVGGAIAALGIIHDQQQQARKEARNALWLRRQQRNPNPGAIAVAPENSQAAAPLSAAIASPIAVATAAPHPQIAAIAPAPLAHQPQVPATNGFVPKPAVVELNQLRRNAGLLAVIGEPSAHEADEITARKVIEKFMQERGSASRGGAGETEMSERIIGRPSYGSDGMGSSPVIFLFKRPGRRFTGAEIVNRMAAMPFAAVRLLDPQLAAIGFGSACAIGECCALMTMQRGLPKPLRLKMFVASEHDRAWNPDLGAIPPTRGRLKVPIEYPAPGAPTATLAYRGGDWPNPLAVCPGYTAPTGPAMILELGAGLGGADDPVISGHSITRAGVEVAHCLLRPAAFRNAELPWGIAARGFLTGAGAVMLIPREPLKPASSYTVSIVADSTPYTWSFRTASTPLLP
ncbi:MAG TPA: protein kinase [Candidatus Binataceae bacterium]